MEWAIQFDPVGKTKRLAEALGCPVQNCSEKQILEYLKQQSTAALNSKMLATLSADERRRGLPIPFKPCVEQDVVSKFLSCMKLNFNTYLCAARGIFNEICLRTAQQSKCN